MSNITSSAKQCDIKVPIARLRKDIYEVRESARNNSISCFNVILLVKWDREASFPRFYLFFCMCIC